jgi:hypothetical protein
MAVLELTDSEGLQPKISGLVWRATSAVVSAWNASPHPHST